MFRINHLKCDICYECIEVCPEEAISIKPVPRVVEINHAECSDCGVCVEFCDKHAIVKASEKDEMEEE